MKTYAFIFARGGSKGVPGKNIRDLAGKPLLVHALEVSSQLENIEKVFVSTDSREIATVAKNFGATVIHRPKRLAQDDSPEWLAWQHAVVWAKSEFGDFERFVSLPATAPLRIAEDITRCFDALDVNTDVVVTMTPAQRSPWFNMVKVGENGELERLVGDYKICRRQDAPVGYDLTTVAYVLRPDFILERDRIWDGRVRGVLVPPERAIDIDNELDFIIADFLMRNRQAKG